MLPELTALSEEDVRGAHLHALREAFMAECLERAAIDRRAIMPLEAELRRRGRRPRRRPDMSGQGSDRARYAEMATGAVAVSIGGSALGAADRTPGGAGIW